MLDIRLIRADPDAVRGALVRRGPGEAEKVDQLLELDELGWLRLLNQSTRRRY